jgi:intergrase/recombinase
MLEFDEKKLEIEDKVCVYSQFHIRGQKASYYLLFTKKLYEQLKGFIKKMATDKLNYFKKEC